ncbi:inorganic diphosphatase [Sphingomonas piscis]|uniref:inorganic diphosphatase n=1 Tax=Sphingomonas piscis TaxID=2714943 RepID=A0A6G7YN12_9SPHN|nr:inorganic diphosphatase [Sphingomonas piscis]QIK78122.1 inorganic diphosphatase [Sphingomonas piscis]
MIPLEQLPHELDRASSTCQAIVEAPAGSRVKVYYDPESHRFRIGKFLPMGMVFPFDFAFIPSTLGGDGDPVDLLILPEAPLPVGCIVKVRILGVMESVQQKVGKKAKRNDRIIARLTESKLFSQVDHIDQLGRTFVDEVTVFFQTYKRMRGQSYEVLSVGGPERAAELIEEAEQAHLAQLGAA